MNNILDQREPTGNWWHDHSLSLVLAAILIAQTILAVWTGSQVFAAEDLPIDFWTWWIWEYNISLVADTFGVILIVLASKVFREKGSAESK